jgi:hypothetical protein
MCILKGKTKLHVLNVPMISPQTVAYIHAVIIDPISISFEDSNARSLQHESTMLDVYTKMMPDSFKMQLQAVLTAYYEYIKGIQGTGGCPKPKFVKSLFEDPKDDEPTPEDLTALPTLDLAAAQRRPQSLQRSLPLGILQGRSFQLLLLNGPPAKLERRRDESGRIDRADAD